MAAACAVTGCSDGDSSPSQVASQAASALESAASQAGEAASSAAAEAKKKIDDISGGVNATSSVTLGDVTTDADGRSTVTVTTDNTTDSEKSFLVQVNFRDKDGNLLDVVAVTVSNVAAGAKGEATARSNRDLSGTPEAEVANALRY
ncbi:FxLYD domain-containing protein [Streptomyces sp. NPDC006879]|uniref:FxLYD domain-containing protein n=1 Tax=Streptomyces sp. NPDC006879 TaxID=3364767 RepID=UPI0036C9346A